MIQVERLVTSADKNTVTFEMRQRLGRAGQFTFHCYMCNDSYLGFDQEVGFEVTVVNDDPDRVVYEYSKED